MMLVGILPRLRQAVSWTRLLPLRLSLPSMVKRRFLWPIVMKPSLYGLYGNMRQRADASVGK